MKPIYCRDLGHHEISVITVWDSVVNEINEVEWMPDMRFSGLEDAS